MFKKILIALAVVVAVFVVAVAFQPAEHSIERSVTIEAPADVVWTQVSDFSRWKDWSPWAKSDPSQKTTIEGEPGTVGHSMAWQGNETGEGEMEITEVAANQEVKFDLRFIEPNESRADTGFELADSSEGVQLTWAMKFENDFMGKMMGVFMDFDEMIGSDFDKGLADIREISQKMAKERALAEAVPEDVPEAETETEPDFDEL